MREDQIFTSSPTPKWLCLQLGSREHYAFPRVLAARGQLAGLLTDTWIPRMVGPLVRPWHPSLSQRRHDEIPDGLVHANSFGRLARDFSYRMYGLNQWDAILARNSWFQGWAVQRMQHLVGRESSNVCFSYSYAARLPFKEAKRRGMKCILGQLDPGPVEDEVVEAGSSQYAEYQLQTVSKPPSQYWQEWQEEVELADEIIVNSAWSAELIVRAGVPKSKLYEVPLAYEAEDSEGEENVNRKASKVGRHIRCFSEEDPLRVLFRGQVILRKGVGQLFDAIKLLDKEPIKFIFAGPIGVKIPSWINDSNKIEIMGLVDRGSAEKLYVSSDVFILPSLSEGFGITQLEAQAHGLPVIASKYCGRVVKDGVNGLILDEVMPESIADSIKRLLNERGLLELLRSNSRVGQEFSMRLLGTKLAEISESL